MSNPHPPPARDEALDGLRGLAALAVLFNHVGLATVAGVCAPPWLLWPADGRAAVMVFFVLSGYVIGLAYPRESQPKDVKHYIWRRVVRLLPINLIAVLLTCAVTVRFDPGTVLTNIFFLQNFAPYGGITVPVIAGNENLWSLNYEVLYYALFIVIWRWLPSLRLVAGLTLAVAILGWYTALVPIFAACYAAGFLFWLSGLALAWHAPRVAEAHANWPSCVLLLLVTWKLRISLNLLAGWPIPLFDGPVVMLYFVDFLPVCLWLFCLVAGRTFPFLRWLKLLSVLLPVVGLAIKWHRPGYFTPLDYRIALGAYLLALLGWNWRPSLQFFRVFAPVGTIAFALYAISRPIQTLVFGHNSWVPQNHAGYLICALITVSACIGAAWWLERRMQPALNRLSRRLPFKTAQERSD